MREISPGDTVSVAASASYCCTAVDSMGEKGKLVIGFETNCVPDLNALLDDGEDPMANHILRAPPSNCLADEADEDLLSIIVLLPAYHRSFGGGEIICRTIRTSMDHDVLVRLKARCSLALVFRLHFLMLL